MVDKIVYLMRGLPSSGKSHTARKLAGERGCICETDNYFYTQLGGNPEKYSYDVRQLKNARDWSYELFQQAVDAGITPIVVDRGNSLSEESQRYVRYCMEQHYSVELKEPDSPWWGEIRVLLKYKQYTRPVLAIWSERLAQLSLSTHRVSASVIQKRIDRWQWNLSIDDILEYNPEQNKQANNTNAVETLSEKPGQSNFSDTKNIDEHPGCTIFKIAISDDITNCLILNVEKEKQANKFKDFNQLQLNVMFDVAETSEKDSGLLDATVLARLNQVVLKTNGLNGLDLGNTLNNNITIDGFSASHGWFFDCLPEDNQMSNKYSKANTSGLAYVDSEVDSYINLFTELSQDKEYILSFNQNETGLIMDTRLDVSVQITPVNDITQQIANSNVTNTTVINSTAVFENKSFGQKLKEKLNHFGDFKFFDYHKGNFNTHSSETDDENTDDILFMFSNARHEKEGKDSRYEITEGDTDKNIESILLAEQIEVQDQGKETKKTSALIDWSGVNGKMN